MHDMTGMAALGMIHNISAALPKGEGDMVI